jgi:TPR repeat protein
LAPAEADRPKQPIVAVPSRPGSRAAELFVRGQKAEQSGDLSAARRLYASAARQGVAAAARDLGRLYDPAYLKHTALGGIDPDPTLARHWYEQAVTMGDVEAGPLLDALALR